MKGNLIIRLAVFLSLTLAAAPAFADHPLITDDADTQGKGHFRVELNTEYDEEDSIDERENETEIETSILYGVTDDVDLTLEVPVAFVDLRSRVGEGEDHAAGIGDISLGAQWRFFEKEDWGLSMAVRPDVIFPTGDFHDELGNGRVGYSFLFITSEEVDPFAFHLNLAYKRNENRINDREDIWHASLAGEWEAIEGLRIVANVGTETNPDGNSNTTPAFFIAGAIYRLSENIEVDAGAKVGLNHAEVDWGALAGVSFTY